MDSISFSKPTIKRKDMLSVLQTLVDERITTSSRTDEFARSFLHLIGDSKQFAHCFRTYPKAIRNALLSLGAGPGIKVAISFLAPAIWARIAEELGCTLILCDVYQKNGCINVENAGCDLVILNESLGTLADAEDYQGLPIIEDISQTLGSVHGQGLAGRIGDVVVCAFEDDLLVSTGGGALAACSSPAVSEKLQRGLDSYERMTDLNASLGLIQLLGYNDSMKRRQEIGRAYRSSLMKTRHKVFGEASLDYEGCCGCFPVFLDTKVDEIQKFCKKYNVPVQMAFTEVAGQDHVDEFERFPISIPYYQRTMLFPIYPFLKANEIDQIQKVLSHLP